MVNRDTYKFAMKCSAAEVDGQWIDVFKQPVGDTSKKSKRGRITLVKTSYSNTPTTVQIDSLNDCIGCEDLMRTVYENGPIVDAYEDFDTIRQRANYSIK